MGHCKDKQLKFEEYLSFFGNRHAHNLTTHHLNQILFLHGFRKLTKRSYIGLTKEEIIVALSSHNLIPPIRFGMSDCNILSVTTSMSAVSLEEVKHDMREIGWEECPVGSVLTINSAAAAVADNSTSILTSQKKRRGKANRSRNDERSGLQSSVSEEGANKDVKEVISGEIATIQVLAKSSKNADPYTWRASGSMRITGLPYNRAQVINGNGGNYFKKQLHLDLTRRTEIEQMVGFYLSRYFHGDRFILMETRIISPCFKRYYRCSEMGCFAKKHIDRDVNDPSMCIVTYKGQHNHTIP